MGRDVTHQDSEERASSTAPGRGLEALLRRTDAIIR